MSYVDIILNGRKPDLKSRLNSPGVDNIAETPVAPVDKTVISDPLADGGPKQANQTDGGNVRADNNTVVKIDDGIRVRQPRVNTNDFVNESEIGAKDAEIERPRMSFAELYERLNPDRPLTKEQLEAENKKKRRDQLFAAIGDGISAMSNLYFTTQYAPNSYDPRQNMSDKVRERYEHLERQRRAGDREWVNGYLRARAMDEQQNTADRRWKLQMQVLKQKRADQRAEARYRQRLHEIELQIKLHGLSEAKAKAARDAARDLRDAELTRSRIALNKARQHAAYRKAGRSGDKDAIPTLFISGKEMKYNSHKDYEKAVFRYAKKYGIDVNEEVNEGDSLYPEKRVRKKDISRLAAEVEEYSDSIEPTATDEKIEWAAEYNIDNQPIINTPRFKQSSDSSAVTPDSTEGIKLDFLTEIYKNDTLDKLNIIGNGKR